jgi:hypothetical protein
LPGALWAKLERKAVTLYVPARPKPSGRAKVDSRVRSINVRLARDLFAMSCGEHARPTTSTDTISSHDTSSASP